jgi:hypothetical protein
MVQSRPPKESAVTPKELRRGKLRYAEGSRTAMHCKNKCGDSCFATLIRWKGQESTGGICCTSSRDGTQNVKVPRQSNQPCGAVHLWRMIVVEEVA